MSKESLQRQADSMNELATLITKLSNFRDAIRDYERLRLEGALFLGPDAEEYQEFEADIDGIRSMAQGPAGEATREVMTDKGPLDYLCQDEIPVRILDEDQVKAVALAVEKALAKAQDKLHKVLVGEA